jgi:hypothetical protein
LRVSQRYRATENDKQQRHEKSKRYREGLRERQAASADEEALGEGQRMASDPEGIRKLFQGGHAIGRVGTRLSMRAANATPLW